MGPQRTRKLLAAMLSLAVLATACGSGTDDTTEDPEPAEVDSGDEGDDGDDGAEVDEGDEGDEAAGSDDLLANLPAELAGLYEGALTPIAASAYDEFEAVDGPWSVCFADSFQGNPWRVTVNNELERLAEEFEAAGLVADFKVSVADGDVAQQTSQIRAFIDQGCDLILSIPASATGLDEAVRAAYDAGIPFVSFAGSVASPYAINVDSNWALWGADMAAAIVERQPGGNVLMVKGIEGQPVAVAQNEAAGPVFSEGGANVVGEVQGDWTPATTKQSVLEALSTNPAPIDAVWTTGSELRLVAEAFEQAGQDVPLITASASGDALAYLQESGTEYYGGAVLPTWTAQTAFRVGVRLLQGQHPKLNTLMVPIPVATSDDLDLWVRPCMSVDAGDIFPVAPTDPLPEDLMDQYFDNGAPTPPFDYANTPDPCA